MTNLTTQSLTTALQNFAAAVHGAATQLVDFTVGSILRAIGEATAGVALWLQGMILQLLAVTRLATSSGADVDSFLADFGAARAKAVAATGLVTFSRFTATAQAVVPVGTIVQTADGTQQFVINADTTNSAYSATLNGFVISAGTSSISVTATSITNGPSGYPDASGNVLANTITALTSAISGVDTVNNAAAFTNGVNPATDAAARTAFVAYLASLAEATVAAIGNAITSLQQGLTYTILENTQYNGTTQQGYFTVVVNDGTGYPSSTLLTNASNAINAVRPLGSTFSVHAPVVLTANVVMTLTTTGVHANAVAAVNAALQSYINGLQLGQTLTYSRLAQIAYDASSQVTNVTGVTLNGGTADLVATQLQIIVAGTMGAV